MFFDKNNRNAWQQRRNVLFTIHFKKLYIYKNEYSFVYEQKSTWTLFSYKNENWTLSSWSRRFQIKHSPQSTDSSLARVTVTCFASRKHRNAFSVRNRPSLWYRKRRIARQNVRVQSRKIWKSLRVTFYFFHLNTNNTQRNWENLLLKFSVSAV